MHNTRLDPIGTSTVLAFQRDEGGDWVAVLDCGHTQHVRHQPPWLNRPWVVTEAGRDAMRGERMRCGWCEQAGADEQESDAP
ncbi:MAG: DUF3565 domain-containing protein [Nitrococcus sp.]|nr:DUF3565 domain-containing protein [Nitrococcus sp.]